MLRICANAPAWTSAVVIADFEGLAGETSAERAMLAACAPHMTLTGAGTAKRFTDVCSRALALSAHECDGSLTADYLACRAALLAEATDTVELVLARAPGQPPTGAPDDRTLSDLVLRCQLALSRGELGDAQADARLGLGVLDDLAPTELHRRMRCDLLAALVAIGIERGCHDEADEALGAVILTDSAPSPVTGSLRIAAALARSATDVAMAVATEVEAQPIGVAAPDICWRPWAALARHARAMLPARLHSRARTSSTRARGALRRCSDAHSSSAASSTRESSA